MEKQQEGSSCVSMDRVRLFTIYLNAFSTAAIQDRDSLKEQIELAEDAQRHLQQQIEVSVQPLDSPFFKQ